MKLQLTTLAGDVYIYCINLQNVQIKELPVKWQNADYTLKVYHTLGSTSSLMQNILHKHNGPHSILNGNNMKEIILVFTLTPFCVLSNAYSLLSESRWGKNSTSYSAGIWTYFKGYFVNWMGFSLTLFIADVSTNDEIS